MSDYKDSIIRKSFMFDIALISLVVDINLENIVIIL